MQCDIFGVMGQVFVKSLEQNILHPTAQPALWAMLPDICYIKKNTLPIIWLQNTTGEAFRLRTTDLCRNVHISLHTEEINLC